MIDLYTFTTPNGRKPAILLEELALPYTVHSVHIGKDEQFAAKTSSLPPPFWPSAPTAKSPPSWTAMGIRQCLNRGRF